jgi:Integrase core domain
VQIFDKIDAITTHNWIKLVKRNFDVRPNMASVIEQCIGSSEFFNNLTKKKSVRLITHSKMEDWRRYYNEERPHSGIGQIVPILLHNSGGASSPSLAKDAENSGLG